MWAKSVDRYEYNDKIYKQCSSCWEYKEASKFFFSCKKTWFMWFRSICKDCEHKKYIMNKDKRLEQSKEYYIKNKNKVLSQVKKYYLKNRDKKIEYARNYREDNNAIIREKDKKRYWNNRYWLETEDQIDNFKLNKFNEQNKNWNTFHNRTFNFIKNNLWYPDTCSICNKKAKIDAHHPDYNKWNIVVLCCKSCHRKIHTWKIKCPDPIDILAAAWRRK